MEEPVRDGTRNCSCSTERNITCHEEGARIWTQRRESDISNMAQLLDNHMSPQLFHPQHVSPEVLEPLAMVFIGITSTWPAVQSNKREVWHPLACPPPHKSLPSQKAEQIKLRSFCLPHPTLPPDPQALHCYCSLPAPPPLWGPHHCSTPAGEPPQPLAWVA